MKKISIILFFLFSEVIFASPQGMQSEIGKQVQEIFNNKQNCELNPKQAQSVSLYASSYDNLEELMKNWNCSDVLAEKSPSWLTNKDSDWWWPVCTSVVVQHFQKYNNSYDKSYDIVRQAIESDYDLCAKPAGTMRGDAKYIPQSQAKAEVNVLDEAKRIELDKGILSFLQNDATRACCNGDMDGDCAKYMKNVGVKWCKPQDDIDKPDKCTDGAYFHYSEVDYEKMTKFVKDNKDIFEKKYDKKIIAKKLTNKFPISSGEIVLAPFVKKDGTLSNSFGIVAHEFGHACSSIHRQLAINSGSLDELTLFKDRMNTGTNCLIKDVGLKTYSKMFNYQDLNESSINCLVDLAKNAENQRFKAGKCNNGCPYDYIEESFANLLWIYSMPKDKWYPHVLPDFCYKARDSRHELTMDDMSCYAKTPKIIEWLKDMIGCKK